MSDRTLAIRKVRDGAAGAEIGFTPREELGTDEDGDPITTIVIDWNVARSAPMDREKPKRRRWSAG